MTDAPGLRPRPTPEGSGDRTPPREGRPAVPAGRSVDETGLLRPGTGGSYVAPVPPVASTVVTGPRTATAPAALSAPQGRRRAKLAVASVDPWSVFRFTLVFSVTLLIIWVVAAAVLWQLLNGMHVFDSLTSLVNDTFFSTKSRTAEELFNFKRTMVWAAGLGVLNAILFTALGTLGAFIYNLCARIVGGIEVTLSNRG